MVLNCGDINIIADMEGTTGIKLHNNRQKLRNRFDIIRKLGQGTYGKVQLAVNKDTGEEVAIKTIRKSKIETEQDLVRIQREIQIMSSVQHPHIIHIYEVFENKEKIVLVMEYASGGELYDYLSYKKFLEEHEARRVFRQVAAAVYYCHKNMICHRDLKLENILLDEKGNAKIADFGLSNVFDEKNFLSTFCGSPLYASPEIVQGTPYYGPEVDCWSLGVLLYTLVYGAMPFDGSNFKRLVKQISEGDYYEPKELSDASSLIRRMLTVAPTKRATIDDICSDEWVDTGEEIPLADISQKFCSQMPVRLDYLLALTAANTDAQLPLLTDSNLPAANNEQEIEKSSDATAEEPKAENEEHAEINEEKSEIAESNGEVLKTEECNTVEKKVEVPEGAEQPKESEADKVVAEKGVKRVSSFGKKATGKSPLIKSKTSTENTPLKSNGVGNRFLRLKKSGSETEKKGPVTPPTSPAVKAPLKTPAPFSKPVPKLNRGGSLDKSDEPSKPPIRGTRFGSPVKQVHDSSHHKGCTAADSNNKQIDTKKSPPKTVTTRRASPVPTREVSPRKSSIGTIKPVPKASTSTVARPKSPVKSVVKAVPDKTSQKESPPESGEQAVKEVTSEKRGSIEIAPLKVTKDEDETPQPMVSFTPKNRGGFTLLGVKSEVMFDVENSQTTAEVKAEDKNNSKVIKYVATVKKHGKDASKLDDGPERVTLLQLKCAPSEDDMSCLGASSASLDKNKEQCGYSVYRSKYRSIQKYRSVVEHQIESVNDENVKEEEEEKRQADVEHCDSFSSAGSNDDLEDVFESLNSETMFTSLLSRTRNLIQRLSSGSIGINASSSGAASFSFSTPGISLLLTTNPQSSSTASSNNYIGSRRFGRSTSRSSQESEQSHRRFLDDTSSAWERRSRYEDFLASSSSRVREDPQKELISTFLRHRNQSLDTSRRPRSYYGSATTGCLPGSRRLAKERLSSQENDIGDHYHHYSKSFSRQVSEESMESSSTSSSHRLARPRSFLASNLSGSSIHRDYSRSVSQAGGTSYAEEEEIKKEHKVSDDAQKSVVTTKECRRSVSQTESKVVSNKQNEHLSRQDSGIESMFDVNSPTCADKNNRPAPVKEECPEQAARSHRGNEDDDDDSSIHVSDSCDTGSVGSDSTCNDHWANSTSPSHISPSRSCGEESVGDRIRRKSFYARFNESRNPRSKVRKQNLPSSIPSNSHLRHLLEADPYLESRNTHFDHHLHQSEPFSHHHRSPSQRWSVHLHSPTGFPEDYSPFNIPQESPASVHRRSSFTGASEDHAAAGTSGPSMNRTHSLPEESVPPESPSATLPRPRRLDLYDRTANNGLDDHFLPSRRSWRQYGSNPSASSFRDPLESSWESTSFNRPGVGNVLSSLMDSLESPSEVLQKAMELCDSLRKVK